MTRALALLLLLLVPAAGGAQEQAIGSRYLSLDGWTYEAIAALHARGLLPALDPLAQPYTRREVASALITVDTVRATSPVKHWVRLLRAELKHEILRDSSELGFEAYAGASASTSRRLDPLRPLRADGSGAWPVYALNGWAERGRFAIDIRVQHDFWYEGDGRGDPDGQDPGGLVAFNRTDNAYLSARYSLGSLTIGRLRRNWAPLGSTGLMIAGTPTTYPQLGFEIGGRRLVVRALAAQLSEVDFEPRFLVANQLEYRVPGFAISIGEAQVHVSEDEGIGLWQLNPVDIFFFGEQGRARSNTMLNGALFLQRGGTTIAGEALLDDIDLAPEFDDSEPLLFALAGSVRNTSLLPVELGLDYRVVSAWAYRTQGHAEQWSEYGRGLGDPWSDYDRLTLSASWYPQVPGLRLTPTLAVQRRGEGDLRQRIGQDTAWYRAQRTLFLGVRETAARVALRGHYQPARSFFVEFDGGANFVKNADHVLGEKKREFSGVVRTGFSWRTPR